MTSLEELIDSATSAKNFAADLYREEKYDDAIATWKESAKLVLKAVCVGPESLSRPELSSLDHAINTNLAMAHYKIKNFGTAVMYCDKALLRRNTMPRDLLEKCLYRKASAEYEICHYENCKTVCDELLEEFPRNAAAKQLLNAVTRDLAEEAKTDKATYSKLFQKLEAENRSIGCFHFLCVCTLCSRPQFDI